MNINLNYLIGSSNRTVAAEWNTMLTLSASSFLSLSDMPKLGSTKSPVMGTILFL
jgi:hypothetical protein